MNTIIPKLVIITFFILVLNSTTGLANQKEKFVISKNMQSIIDSHILIISRWVKNPLIVNLVIKQNNKDTPLEKIQAIDREWVNGTQNELAQNLQENQVGQLLRTAVEVSHAYTEAILCDNKGAIVSLFPKTSDYWQGDEDKFIQSYNKGMGKVYFGPLAFDESTQSYSVQVSIPVNYLNNTIGVLIVGIRNIESETE